MKKGHTIIFVLYLVLAFYLINNALGFVTLPEMFMKVDKWILFIAGIFLVLGGFNSLRLRKYRGY